MHEQTGKLPTGKKEGEATHTAVDFDVTDHQSHRVWCVVKKLKTKNEALKGKGKQKKAKFHRSGGSSFFSFNIDK